VTNTTQAPWLVDGVSLQTYAWNLKTWGGAKQGAPPMRGSDVVIPGRAGARWVPKQPDSRTIPFDGWVIGANQDGYIGDEQTFQENWQALKRLMFTPRRQIELTKQWRNGPDLIRAVGHGQCVNGMSPEMTGPRRATFSIDVFMADPYFYGDQIVEEFVITAGNSVTRTLDVPGDDVTIAVEVQFVGALTTPRMTVGDQWVQHSTVAGGVTAVIDVAEFTAKETGVPVLGKVTNGKPGAWLSLAPGPNIVTFTRGGGAGTARIKYRPVWL
jgi:hypothetical protein